MQIDMPTLDGLKSGRSERLEVKGPECLILLSKWFGWMITYESSCSEPASKSCNTIAKEWGQININTTIVHLTQ